MNLDEKSSKVCTFITNTPLVVITYCFMKLTFRISPDTEQQSSCSACVHSKHLLLFESTLNALLYNNWCIPKPM